MQNMQNYAKSNISPPLRNPLLLALDRSEICVTYFVNKIAYP